MLRNARLGTAAAIGAAALALGGCATAVPADHDPVATAAVDVVAVTDVYGSIVAAIGGDLVEVTSIVSGAAQDPHEYEATARDQLAVRDADLVIVNGGGYDDFMTRLLASSTAVVVNASEASGLLPRDAGEGETPHAQDRAQDRAQAGTDADHDHAAADHDHSTDADAADHHHIAGFNEHVWYSIHGVEHIVEHIAETLTDLLPGEADRIAAGARAFLTGLDGLHDRVHALADELGGGDVISTEVVAAYLLEDLGLRDVTPGDFAAAVEAGTGISARTLDELLRRLDQRRVRLLAVNPQSAGAEVELVRDAATAAGVPIVEFAETLPPDTDYLGWLESSIDAVESALR